jgi:hypothetical protein
VFIQWCVKGVCVRFAGEDHGVGIDETEARAMIDGDGIRCNWWRRVKEITPRQLRDKLTQANLERHIHDYARFKNETPFISLTAGCVERDAALSLNRIYEAQDVALRFATDYGKRDGYLFYCWVVVGLKPAAGQPAGQRKAGLERSQSRHEASDHSTTRNPMRLTARRTEAETQPILPSGNFSEDRLHTNYYYYTRRRSFARFTCTNRNLMITPDYNWLSTSRWLCSLAQSD